MDQFQLTDALLTGVGDIDEQHRKLFALANRLLETGTASCQANPRRASSGAAFVPCRSIADSSCALYECSADRLEFAASGKVRQYEGSGRRAESRK